MQISYFQYLKWQYLLSRSLQTYQLANIMCTILVSIDLYFFSENNSTKKVQKVDILYRKTVLHNPEIHLKREHVLLK